MEKEKKVGILSNLVPIQILQYEFLGPIRLSEWGPPMEEVVYILFAKNKDVFNIIYAGESGKTEASDFFTKNEQFKCWLSNAGGENNLYLSIYPMWESNQSARKQLVHKIVDKYKPVCNQINEDSENVPTSTARTIEQEPEPEEAKDDLLDELKKKTGEE
ncbi:MAG: hypothetical protein CM1200mP23_2740 [Nitrososphaerota archaeon]|nr:MAG: hypothetical protein CM1200mP23_2740 [Nitrososphaerota archaeon]